MHIPQIVAFAQANPSPSVYAAALRACAHTKAGKCLGISYADWTSIEPENGVAWLGAASEADKWNSQAAMQAALEKAANAPSYEHHRPNFALVLETPALKAASPVIKAAVLSDIAAFSKPSMSSLYSGARSYCDRARADIARAELCSKLAQQIKDKDRHYDGLNIAAYIGEKVGWSRALTTAMQQESWAVQKLELRQSQVFSARKTLYTCENANARLEAAVNKLSKPDRDVGEALLKESKQSIAELAPRPN